MEVELRPCMLLKWALCDGNCEKCRTFATTETVYNRYTDTAGNYHWTGAYSGEHIIKMDGGEGEKMVRLIDVDTIFNGEPLLVNDETLDTVRTIIKKINNAPTVDPVKHGQWIKMSDADGIYYVCSECGNELPRVIDSFDLQFDLFPKLKCIDKTTYCPNCGTRMDGEVNGNN